MEGFTPEPEISSEPKKREFTKVDRDKLLDINLGILADLHKLQESNQQKRIDGEFTGMQADENEKHIQKRIDEVEAEVKSLREIEL